MSGRGASSARARAGKFKKPTRGGGKHFSRDLRPLDADGNEISMWAVDGAKKDSNSEEGSEEEDSESEESEDGIDAGPSGQAADEDTMTREERKKQKAAAKAKAVAKKKKGVVQVGDMPTDSEEESDDDMPANPNHSKAARDMTKAPVNPVQEATEGMKKLSTAPMSRREREAIEAQQAKERYQKRLEEGKTDSAKDDLARLAIIRERRKAESERRVAEQEEREAQEKAKGAEHAAREAKKREAALGKPAKKAKK